MFVALNNWIVELPTTLAIAAVVGISVAVSVFGLVLIHVSVPHPLRRAHNEVAGFTIAVVGVIYAVLLAFIAVAVWEDFGKADALVQTEANLVGNLYRDTVGLPDPPATGLRHTLFVYAETVVQDEWPALAAGRVEDAAGWQLMDKFHLSLAQFRPSDPGSQAIETEMLHNLNALYDARRGRFHAAGEGLPPILWWNLIAGAALTIVFSYLFGVPNFAMHVVMVAMLAASIALVLSLIILLDNPFRGQNHVSAAPFERLVRTVEDMAYPKD
ncbi:bestrophin-like domain [Roseiarcus sp.]|uniref:bestrophin-like domain n=1 Tax=Roseiarcus sp. TaxID=1969460 RepID=UPI003F96C4C1